MPRFEVRFLKAVSDDTGHERKVCQRALEVEADCWAGALSAAREQLGTTEGTSDWMRYADAIELERLECTAASRPVRLGKDPNAAEHVVGGPTLPQAKAAGSKFTRAKLQAA
jgi:hypothetical protein